MEQRVVAARREHGPLSSVSEPSSRSQILLWDQVEEEIRREWGAPQACLNLPSSCSTCSNSSPAELHLPGDLDLWVSVAVPLRDLAPHHQDCM